MSNDNVNISAELHNLIEKYNMNVKRYMISDTTVEMLDALIQYPRKIIEGILIEIFNIENPTKFLKSKNTTILYDWSKINKFHHYQIISESEMSFASLFDSFNTLIDFLGNLLNKNLFELFSIINFNLEYTIEEKWTQTSEIAFSNYQGYINSYKKIGPKLYMYEISSKNLGSSQIQKHYIYHHLEHSYDYHLSSHSYYIFDAFIEKLNSNQSITRKYLKNPKISNQIHIYANENNKRLLKLKKVIEEKSNVSIIDFLKLNYSIQDFFDKEDDSFYFICKLKEILNEMSEDKAMFFLNIVLLKENEEKNKKNNSSLKRNFSKKHSPLEFEFWTKNQRGSAFSFFEKEIIFDLIKDIFPNSFKNKMNEEFFIENKNVNQYFQKYDELKWNFINEENNFNAGYENKKIIIEENELNEKIMISIENKKIIDELDFLFSTFDSNKYITEGIMIDLNNEFIDDNSKKEAFIKIIRSNLSIIIGPAGTGKTKLSKGLIKEFIKKNESFVFLAPTHKAKQLIDDIDNNNTLKSYTIQKVSKNNNINEMIKNEIDNIIIDEFSMIEDYDWKKILEMINKKENLKRIIIMGDNKQIPPIKSIGLYYLFLEKFKNNLIELKKNFRQSNETYKNVVNKYREIEKIIQFDYLEDYTSADDFVNKVKNISDGINDIVLLSPIKYSLYGTESLIEIINQHSLNLKRNDQVIVLDDFTDLDDGLYKNKIMKVVKADQNYIYFEGSNLKAPSRFQNNGFWEIEKIENTGKYYLKYILDSEKNDFAIKKINAMTIHQSQGSTFESVCLVIPPNSIFNEKFKKLIYTAITRGEKFLKILIYKDDISKIT